MPAPPFPTLAKTAYPAAFPNNLERLGSALLRALMAPLASFMASSFLACRSAWSAAESSANAGAAEAAKAMATNVLRIFIMGIPFREYVVGALRAPLAPALHRPLFLSRPTPRRRGIREPDPNSGQVEGALDRRAAPQPARMV